MPPHQWLALRAGLQVIVLENISPCRLLKGDRCPPCSTLNLLSVGSIALMNVRYFKIRTILHPFRFICVYSSHNLPRQIERFHKKSSVFISRIHRVQKGRHNVEDDWANHLSVAFKWTNQILLLRNISHGSQPCG